MKTKLLLLPLVALTLTSCNFDHINEEKEPEYIYVQFCYRNDGTYCDDYMPFAEKEHYDEQYDTFDCDFQPLKLPFDIKLPYSIHSHYFVIYKRR